MGKFLKFFFLCSILSYLACNSEIRKPSIAIDDFVVEEGFEIEVIASEPLLHSPIATKNSQAERVKMHNKRSSCQIGNHQIRQVSQIR